MSPRPRVLFTFHAEGHAFSGDFFRPVRQQVEALAATSLPTIGGHAHTRVHDFHIPRLVKFAAAHTHVSGSMQDERTAVTHATATIERLNILDFITADRIVARLTSEHTLGNPEGHIIAVGSAFDNLKIAGFPVKVILRHELFLGCRTYSELTNQVASDRNSGKICATTGGVTLCSLVERIETDLPGVDKRKHVLTIPHFGHIALAEVLAEQGTRTLTMIRLDLGSPDDGTATVSETRINGQPLPPQT